MTSIKSISAKKVISKLKKIGFVETHQRGSHLYLKSVDGNKIVTIPVHGNKDIPVETLYNIIVHQAGISVEYFLNIK